MEVNTTSKTPTTPTGELLSKMINPIKRPARWETVIDRTSAYGWTKIFDIWIAPSPNTVLGADDLPGEYERRDSTIHIPEWNVVAHGEPVDLKVDRGWEFEMSISICGCLVDIPISNAVKQVILSNYKAKHVMRRGRGPHAAMVRICKYLSDAKTVKQRLERLASIAPSDFKRIVVKLKKRTPQRISSIALAIAMRRILTSSGSELDHEVIAVMGKSDTKQVSPEMHALTVAQVRAEPGKPSAMEYGHAI